MPKPRLRESDPRLGTPPPIRADTIGFCAGLLQTSQLILRELEGMIISESLPR